MSGLGPSTHPDGMACCIPIQRPFPSPLRLCLAGAVFGVTAFAQEPATPPSAQDPALLRRIEALEKEVSQLRTRGEATAGTAKVTGAAAEKAETHYPDVKLTGFFHLDAGWYSQDADSKATLGDIDDGLGFRRARLAATGKVSEDISFIMEFDAAQAQARFVDVWMQIDKSPVGKIRIGRFRQPFGMDELTSIRELPFLERYQGFALGPFRQTGVQLADTAMGERMTWAVSGYRFQSDNFGDVFSDSGGYGMAARVTGLALEDGDTVLHLGGDYSHNDPGLGAVRFASQNEFFVGQNPTGGPGGLVPSSLISVPFFVDTGVLAADHTDLWNFEAAAGFGSVVLQAEARFARVDMGGTAETFPAVYGQARWVVTGEKIPYVKNGGVFGRVKPTNPVASGGAGAIELAARVSYMNLDGAYNTGPGRSLTALTVGTSWYLSDRAKLQLNWIHDELDDKTLGLSRSDTFALRAQIDF